MIVPVLPIGATMLTGPSSVARRKPASPTAFPTPATAASAIARRPGTASPTTATATSATSVAATCPTSSTPPSGKRRVKSGPRKLATPYSADVPSARAIVTSRARPLPDQRPRVVSDPLGGDLVGHEAHALDAARVEQDGRRRVLVLGRLRLDAELAPDGLQPRARAEQEARAAGQRVAQQEGAGARGRVARGIDADRDVGDALAEAVERPADLVGDQRARVAAVRVEERDDH